jgi:hypothetical protein
MEAKMRERVRRGTVLRAVVGASVLIAGCGKGVEIAKVPLISPVVVPAPEVFKMNVSVKN